MIFNMINTVFIQKESYVLPYYINNTITTSVFLNLIIQVIFYISLKVSTTVNSF